MIPKNGSKKKEKNHFFQGCRNSKYWLKSVGGVEKKFCFYALQFGDMSKKVVLYRWSVA